MSLLTDLAASHDDLDRRRLLPSSAEKTTSRWSLTEDRVPQ